MGTLAEVTLAWNLLAVNAIQPCPLILIGPGWEAVINTLVEQQQTNINDKTRRLVVSVPSVDAAVKALALWQ